MRDRRLADIKIFKLQSWLDRWDDKLNANANKQNVLLRLKRRLTSYIADFCLGDLHPFHRFKARFWKLAKIQNLPKRGLREGNCGAKSLKNLVWLTWRREPVAISNVRRAISAIHYSCLVSGTLFLIFPCKIQRFIWIFKRFLKLDIRSLDSATLFIALSLAAGNIPVFFLR